MRYEIKRLTGALLGVFALFAMIGGISMQVRGQCFGTADQILSAAASARGLTAPQAAAAVSGPAVGADNSSPSIVGMWHVHYTGPMFPGGDQEAYQIFNAGGTEVHNPNTPTDGVCLGVWSQTARSVKLTHRVWLYDNGNFIGVGHLEVNITVGDKGMSQTGTFTLQLFDLAGNAFTPPLPGTLTGERVVPN